MDRKAARHSVRSGLRSCLKMGRRLDILPRRDLGTNA